MTIRDKWDVTPVKSPSSFGEWGLEVTNALHGAGVVSAADETWGVAGDGVTDDATAIQALVDAGAGKVIAFPAGTYKVSTAINLPSNTTLIGPGEITGGRLFRVDEVENITIDGLILSGSYAGGGDPPNQSVPSILPSVIYSTDSDHITIRRCRIQNFTDYGLAFDGCTDVSITSNTFLNGGGRAIGCMSETGSNIDFEIRSNRIIDFGQNGHLRWSGIHVSPGGVTNTPEYNYRFTIDNNYITGSAIGRFGITIGANYSSVTDNIIQNVDSDGIAVSGNDVYIAGNTLDRGEGDALGAGILVFQEVPDLRSNVRVIGNRIRGAYTSGVSLTNNHPTGVFERVTVSLNDITGAGSGVRVRAIDTATEDTIFRNVLVSNNILHGNDAPFDYVAELTDTTGVLFRDNLTDEKTLTPSVTGSTDSEILASLLAAVVSLGFATDDTE